MDGDADRVARPDLGAYEYVNRSIPGVVVCAVPDQVAHAADGAVTVLVRRTGGLAGAVSVEYETADGTARAGVHCQGGSGRVAFGDGQSEGTVRVPVLAAAAGSGPVTFSLRIAGPASGASLGVPAVTTITLHLPAVATGGNPWNIPEAWILEHGLTLTATPCAAREDPRRKPARRATRRRSNSSPA